MSNCAKAFETYRESNKEGFDSTSLGCKKEMDQFLSNRLWKAFMAGHTAGEAYAKEMTKQRFEALFLCH